MHPKLITKTTLFFLLFAATTAYSDVGSGANGYEAIDIGISAASIEGIDHGVAEGIDQGDTDGIDQGDTDGIDQGDTKGIDQGDTDGIDQGDTDGIDQGDTKGIDQGDTDGIDQGDTDGIDQGDTKGIDQGDTDGIDQGDTDGIDQGDTKGIDQGDTDGIDQGDTDGIDQGDTKGIDQGDTDGIDQGDTDGIDQGDTDSVVLIGTLKTEPLSVNGILIDSRSAAITRDGEAFSLSEAQSGQIVTVKGSLKNNTVIAERLALSSKLTGPIESYDAESNTINLLGHIVRIDTATVMSLSRNLLTAGQWIVVDGFTTQPEDVQATRIDAVAGGQVEVAGVITQADYSRMSFYIGNQRIDFSSASLLDVGTGMPQTGQIIRVSGGLASDENILRASIVTESDR